MARLKNSVLILYWPFQNNKFSLLFLYSTNINTITKIIYSSINNKYNKCTVQAGMLCFEYKKIVFTKKKLWKPVKTIYLDIYEVLLFFKVLLIKTEDSFRFLIVSYVKIFPTKNKRLK